MNKILIICGPTATGKTELATILAKEFDGELISADSRQVYRGMDITTGKDFDKFSTFHFQFSKKIDNKKFDLGYQLVNGVPIWMCDVVNPDEDFSVSHWVNLTSSVIQNIWKRNKLPIVVGGTGLYIHALLYPFSSIDVPMDKKLREKLNTLSVEKLQQLTERGSMNDSDWQNPRRLIRKIELGTTSVSREDKSGYNAYVIGLTAPMEELYKRIDMRMEKRKNEGLHEEILKLQKQYDHNLPSMSAIGVNEHAYAKRQMTWFRKQTYIQWFDISNPDIHAQILAQVKKWYTTDDV